MAKPTVAGRLPLDCVSLVGPGQLIVGRGGMRPKGYAVGGLGGEDDRRGGTVGEAERNGGVWWGSSSARLAYLAQVWGWAARSPRYAQYTSLAGRQDGCAAVGI